MHDRDFAAKHVFGLSKLSHARLRLSTVLMYVAISTTVCNLILQLPTDEIALPLFGCGFSSHDQKRSRRRIQFRSKASYRQSNSDLKRPTDNHSLQGSCNNDNVVELSYLDCHIDIQNRSTTQVNLVSGEKNLSCLLNRSDPLLSTDSNEIYEWTKPYTPDHIKKSSCDSDDDRHQNNIPHNIARAQLEDRSYSNKKIQVIMDKGAKDKDFCKPKLLEHFRQTDHRLSWDIECEKIPQRGSNLQVLNTSQPDQS
jgi:hypothetical protein